MAGGGKGGSQTTEVSIPDWAENAAKSNLARADDISKIGYTPYMGPDVAAFTPMQNAAFGATNDAASAFGMGTAQPSMPEPTTYAGGVQGYSAYPLYQQSVDALQAANPAQYNAIMGQFIDPVRGGSFGASMPAPQPAAQPAQDAWQVFPALRGSEGWGR